MEVELDEQIPMAFLVDGDNSQASLISEMLAEASKFGRILIKNVYGNWNSPGMQGWSQVRLDYALQPVQQFANISGKNATDIALIIDAMDIMYQGVVKGFCIVSSDSDFTSLAIRLKKNGAFVVGIGKESTHVSFRRACDRFILVENLKPIDLDADRKSSVAAEKEVKKAAPKESEKKSPKKAVDLIMRGFDSIDTESNSVLLGDLGSAIIKLDSSFDPRTYGKRKLSELLKELPDHFIIEISKDGSGRDLVMKKQKGTKKK